MPLKWTPELARQLLAEADVNEAKTEIERLKVEREKAKTDYEKARARKAEAEAERRTGNADNGVSVGMIIGAFSIIFQAIVILIVFLGGC